VRKTKSTIYILFHAKCFRFGSLQSVPWTTTIKKSL